MEELFPSKNKFVMPKQDKKKLVLFSKQGAPWSGGHFREEEPEPQDYANKYTRPRQGGDDVHGTQAHDANGKGLYPLTALP